MEVCRMQSDMTVKRIQNVLARIAELRTLEYEDCLWAGQLNRDYWSTLPSNMKKSDLPGYNRHTVFTATLLTNIQEKRRHALPTNLYKEIQWAFDTINKAILDGIERENIRLKKKYGVTSGK